jgi:hypothetical protein
MACADIAWRKEVLLLDSLCKVRMMKRSARRRYKELARGLSRPIFVRIALMSTSLQRQTQASISVSTLPIFKPHP